MGDRIGPATPVATLLAAFFPFGYRVTQLRILVDGRVVEMSLTVVAVIFGTPAFS